jgi:large subunit ribosomal protein L21
LFRRFDIYAIIETSGKQFTVTPGQVIDVDLMHVAKGDSVELNRVLVIGDGAKVTIGAPTIEGAKVMATSQGETKGDKIIVFTYKAKVRERKKTGHRQTYTQLLIDKILAPGAEAVEPPKKPRRRKKEVTESGT